MQIYIPSNANIYEEARIRRINDDQKTKAPTENQSVRDFLVA